jgi:hypothetical protein
MVRLAAAGGDHIDQCARLFRAGRHDAARPVVLEAAADQPPAVGQQRRRQRVARQALHQLPVEAKAERARSVGEQTLGDTSRSLHQRPGSCGSDGCSCAPPTQRISCVSV